MNCQATVPDGFLLKGPCPRQGEFRSHTDDKQVCGLHYPLHSESEREQEWMRGVSYDSKVEAWIFAPVQVPGRGEFSCLDLRRATVRTKVELGMWMQQRGWNHCEELAAPGAHFLQNVSIDVRDHDTVVLSGAIFEKEVILASLTCKNFIFTGCQFGGLVSCLKSNFPGDFSGLGAKFGAGATFVSIPFERVELSNVEFAAPVSFRNCSFQGHTNFSKAAFTNSAEVKQRIVPPQLTSSIRNEFYECNFLKDTSFRDTKFLANVDFSLTKFHASCDFQDAHFTHCPDMLGTEFGHSVLMDGIRIGPGNAETFRLLKKTMEDQGRTWLATRFYGDELRQQLRDTPWRRRFKADSILNALYFGISNYGRTWWLPFIWLLVVTLACWLFFGLTGAFVIRAEAELEGWLFDLEQWPLWQRSLVFSIQNIKPAWLIGSPVMIVTTWWAQAVVVLQSVANIFFVAMGVLAMRKRFRI